jgi:hypothetical protein
MFRSLSANPRVGGASSALTSPAIETVMADVANREEAMKRVEYKVAKSGDEWIVERDGKKLHAFPSLTDAEAAAFNMARTDRDQDFHVDVHIEGAPSLWDKGTK